MKKLYNTPATEITKIDVRPETTVHISYDNTGIPGDGEKGDVIIGDLDDGDEVG